jgi:HlyD family secretion protein
MAGGWGMVRRRLWRAGQLVVVLCAVGTAVYWTQFAPVPVAVHTVQRGEIVAEVMGTGTLDAHFSATISPKISGLVAAVLVDQGDRVEGGQILLHLDDRDLKRQVEVSESNVSVAQAAVERQEAERNRALAVLDQARFDFDRVKDLIEESNAAAVESQEATKALRVAEAEVARSDAALAEVRMQVIAAEKTLEFYRAKLADTVVVAPFGGLIARRDRDPGDVVVPGSSVLLLVATDELWISSWVDETEMERLKVGQPGRVYFRSKPEHAYAGEVARLGREVDRETREFLVDVRVRELPENWAVGQRAEVYIETGRQAEVLCLPTRLVVWRGRNAGTFVDQAGRATWRALKLGLRGREIVEVVNGLNVGDSVVTPADAKSGVLKPGQRVLPVPELEPAGVEQRP